ncbi:hypothetical protein BD779DRAFT_756568 [Infundibulicybe gibba]|nr:hypothetical protein BD779DRAFT_756568 [Infundibulicybe gibba]
MANSMESALLAMTGPLLIGFLLNSCLFGALTVQIYFYYSSFPKDRILIKSLVGGVYLVEIAQTGLTIYDAYVVFSTGFGNVAILIPIRTVWIYALVLSPIVFYAHRISVLYNSWKLGLVIIILSVTQLVVGEVSAVLMKVSEELHTGTGRGLVVARINTVVALACDVVIAICLILWLLRARRGSEGSKKTHKITWNLLRVTVENGIVLATVNIVAMIFSFYLDLSPLSSSTATKWYSITLLVSLNNRTSIQPGAGVNPPYLLGSSFRRPLGPKIYAAGAPPATFIRSFASRYSTLPV